MVFKLILAGWRSPTTERASANHSSICKNQFETSFKLLGMGFGNSRASATRPCISGQKWFVHILNISI